MGLIHTAAILSRETEKALFYRPRPRSEKLGGQARKVKQSYFSLSGQNGRRLTKTHEGGSVWTYHVRVNVAWVATQQHCFAMWFTGPPDPPQDVKVVSFTVPDSETVSVNVSWTPGYSGGYDQQFSIHYRKKGSGSDCTEVVIGLLPENMHTVQKLSPNTEYEFMMQASNRRGNSPASPLAQVTTSGNKEIAFLLLIRTVIKRGGGGNFAVYQAFLYIS